MKKIIAILASLFFVKTINSQSIGIGTNNPQSSAILDIQSTDKGLLVPRMSTTQRTAIQNPSTGLIIWNTTCKQLETFNGTVWTTPSGVAACSDISSGTQVCTQTWMSTNLNVSNYRNGDLIPQVTDSATWINLATGAWCWYKNDSATYALKYGKLYNWYAVNDSRGLAPVGWHIPNNAEWDTLSSCFGGNGFSGGALKEVGSVNWKAPNSGATNASGLNFRPSGYRRWLEAIFYGDIELGIYWSSTSDGPALAWARLVGFDGAFLNVSNYFKQNGFSVRCIKD
jgi:uncharacterized protein (TIGR02145 family)